MFTAFFCVALAAVLVPVQKALPEPETARSSEIAVKASFVALRGDQP
jgi:hypothetical protein